jgi:hypothetical protein
VFSSRINEPARSSAQELPYHLLLRQSQHRDSESDSMQRQHIVLEFIGGPLDGHCQPVVADHDELILTAAIPVNENVFRMLDGQPRGPARPSRTFALYELHKEHGYRYCFLGFRTAADLNAENWCV